MKTEKSKLRMLFYNIYEKNGMLKVLISMFAIVVLLGTYALTGGKYEFLWILSLIPSFYIASLVILGVLYTWIIRPIILLFNWVKKKIFK